MKNDDVYQVCESCGVSANVLTCLKLHKHPPIKLKSEISTWNMGVCDVCKLTWPVTQPRDFFYPDFNLLIKATKPKKK